MSLLHFAMRAGAVLFLALSAHAQLVGDRCSYDTDCDSDCCLSQRLPHPRCEVSRTFATGASCLTQDGCDCVTGHCDNGECAVCGVNGDCESGCCASQKEGRPCVPFMEIPNGQQCDTFDGCDCASGTCAPCPVAGCIGRVCSQGCGVNSDCESECCASQKDGRPCVPFMEIPNGQQCDTFDGCDCASGTCSPCTVAGCIGRVCSQGCGVNGDCESGCCASQQDGRPCVPFMQIANGQPCDTIDGCDCASGICSPCPVPGCIGRICAQQVLPVDPTSPPTPGDRCSFDRDCASDCCLSQRLPHAQCEVARAIATGADCLTKDGCDCVTGHCDNGECAACGVNGDCESGCCASQKDGRPCVPFMQIANGQPCDTIDGCDCASGICSPCPVPGCIGRVCAQEVLPVDPTSPPTPDPSTSFSFNFIDC